MEVTIFNLSIILSLLSSEISISISGFFLDIVGSIFFISLTICMASALFDCTIWRDKELLPFSEYKVEESSYYLEIVAISFT